MENTLTLKKITTTTHRSYGAIKSIISFVLFSILFFMEREFYINNQQVVLDVFKSFNH